jgi:hypothetical protein
VVVEGGGGRGAALRAEEGRGAVEAGASLTSGEGDARADAGRRAREAVEAEEATLLRGLLRALLLGLLRVLRRAELGRAAVLASRCAFFSSASSARCLRLSVALSALASSTCRVSVGRRRVSGRVKRWAHQGSMRLRAFVCRLASRAHTVARAGDPGGLV